MTHAGGRPPLVDSKACTRCGETKPRADFQNKTGTLRQYCLPCNREVALEYHRRKHPPKEPTAPMTSAERARRTRARRREQQAARRRTRLRGSPTLVGLLTNELVGKPRADLSGLPVVPADGEIVPSADPVSEAPAPTPGRREGRDEDAATSVRRPALAAKARDGAPPIVRGGFPAKEKPHFTAVVSDGDPQHNGGGIDSAVRPPAPAALHKHPFVHVAPRPPAPKRVPLMDADLTRPTGAERYGMRWPCAHNLDQLGGQRCIRCCVAKPKHYVLRKAAGGSPAAWRWLCAPCLDVYIGLGLADRPRAQPVNPIPVAWSEWEIKRQAGVPPGQIRNGSGQLVGVGSA